MFIDQTLRATNIETIYEEFVAQIFFAVEGCWDPKTLQDEALEGSPLGSLANYRSKVIDAVLNYVACRQKWYSFHRGPLAQCFPTQIPPRKYLEHKVAQSLKLPFICKEAFLKLGSLLFKCKQGWELSDKIHDEQMKIGQEILELGCYCLPGEVIANEKIFEYINECLKQDMLMSLKKVRRGN